MTRGHTRTCTYTCTHRDVCTGQEGPSTQWKLYQKEYNDTRKNFEKDDVQQSPGHCLFVGLSRQYLRTARHSPSADLSQDAAHSFQTLLMDYISGLKLADYVSFFGQTTTLQEVHALVMSPTGWLSTHPLASHMISFLVSAVGVKLFPGEAFGIDIFDDDRRVKLRVGSDSPNAVIFTLILHKQHYTSAVPRSRNESHPIDSIELRTTGTHTCLGLLILLLLGIYVAAQSSNHRRPG